MLITSAINYIFISILVNRNIQKLSLSRAVLEKQKKIREKKTLRKIIWSPFQKSFNKERLVQDGGVEGRALTPSCESTRITTNCRTINRKTLELTKKDTPHPKTKEKPQGDGKNGAITIKSNPITAGWVTHKLENTYTTEVHPLEWKFWAPHQASQPGGPATGGGIPKIRLWRLVGFDCRTSTGLGDTEIPLLQGTHRVLCAWGLRGRSSDPMGDWTGPTCGIGGSPAEAGSGCGSLWGQGHCSRSSGKYSLAWALPESAISPTRELDSLQCWVVSGQTTNKEGTQPHPSADKQIKVLLSSAH